MKFSRKSYIDLLKIIKTKYKFIFATDWNKYKRNKNYIILRHDVDFDTSLALKMAKIEKKQNIKANYFFLLRDDFYDLYSIETYKNIKLISNLGHKIGLHINPKIYNFHRYAKKLLKRDIKYFEFFYKIKINSISFHQPSIHSFDKINLKLKFNSYNRKVMNHYKYFSDSSMKFNLNHFNNQLKSNANMQLLIHPIWWITEKHGIKKKLKEVYGIKKLDIKKNFINYNNILNIKNEYN